MGVNTKTIKRRIKSVNSTRKITKAMEMISAVKMRKAVNNVLATRSYAKFAWDMLLDVSKKTKIDKHPLLIKRPIKKVGVVLVLSNRGMAGGFNSRLLMTLHDYLKKINAQGDLSVEIMLSGRKGRKIYSQFGYQIAAEFEKYDLTAKITDISALSKMTVDSYANAKYDLVLLVYNDFVSAIRQVPRIKPLLPLTGKDTLLGEVEEVNNKEENKSDLEFLYEPSPADVLEVLLPRMVEMQIYQAVLESDASEHSARMVAMKNASDAASDMIAELNYNYNKARQAAITQEISEIVGGAAALV